MFLVRSGNRAKPLLTEALDHRESLPLVLTILGDIGDPESLPKLQQFRDDPESEVAKAALDALEAIKVQGVARA